MRESYYNKIQSGEYESLLHGKSLDLTPQEVDKLIEIDNGDFSFTISDNEVQSTYYNYIMNDMIDITISKIRDEYFLVELILNEGDNYHYYKCDQMDGLLRFLHNFKIRCAKPNQLNHIKEYNSYSVSPIEELSEYLQEIFDKYHIREWDSNMDRDSIELTDIFWTDTNDINELMITTYRGDTPPRFEELISDVVKSHKLLQLRLGREIRLTFGEATIYFNI